MAVTDWAQFDGGVVMAFLVIVCTAIILAFVSVAIRRFLSRGRKPSSSDQNDVAGRLFQINYRASGPIAEFVIVLIAISFTAIVFWVFLGWHKGP